jgi:hypothetical protein
MKSPRAGEAQKFDRFYNVREIEVPKMDFPKYHLDKEMRP